MQIGIDFGGTKIEAAAIGSEGEYLHRVRIPTPSTYTDALDAVRGLVETTERAVGASGTVGIGSPGAVEPRTGVMRNANATYLNGRAFRQDLERSMGRAVRLANDANCMALSEVVDGAAAGARSAFAVIIGTGCGGGLVVDGEIVEGGHALAGEWGHVPLPWMTDQEHPGPECWCRRRGCLETWIAGPGLESDHRRATAAKLSGTAIIDAMRQGDEAAAKTFERYVDRLGRGLAMLTNIFDPEVFVLAGGMSNISELYYRLPAIIGSYAFGSGWDGRVVPARWGDSSGVRGAARLWQISSKAKLVNSEI